MTKLVELLEKIIGGGTPSKNENKYWNGNIPWASVKDIGENQVYLSYTQDSITKEGLAKSSSNLIPKGNVIIPTRMGLGRCVINKIDTAINQDLKALIPKKDKLNNKYLLYWLKFNAALIESMGSGTTVKGIRLEQLTELELNDIDIKIQQKIARILSNYDDLIENNNRRIKILEEMAQKIYKEWFLDFKFPGHETTAFKDSPLGKIPKDWEVKKLSEISLLITRGVTPKYEECSKRYIINQKVNRGFCLDLSNLKELASDLEVPKEKFAQQGDILINSLGEGTIGRVHYYNDKNNYYAVDQHITICRLNKSLSEYIYSYIASDEGQARFASLKTGATNMTMLNISSVRDFQVVVPDTNLLNKFSEIIKNIFDLKVSLEHQNQTLKQTRDILLPRLISGEIDVENMEII